MGTARGEGAGGIRALGEIWLEVLLADPAVGGGAGGAVCSPAGLWMALCALEAGAEGATRRELRGIVGPDASGDAAVRELRRGGVITSATGLTGPGGASSATGVLVNEVGLEARWERPFEPLFTRAIAFTDARGLTHDVPAMVAEVPVEDAWTVAREHGRVTVVELRARSGDGAATTPAAPPARVRFALGENPQVPPAEVIAASWTPAAEGTPIRGSRSRHGRHPEAILLELPRLTLCGDVDVSPLLAAIGAESLLSPSAELPEFPGVFPERPYQGRTVQRCFVRCDEEGLTSEAAAEAAEAAEPAEAAEHRTPERSWTDGPGQLLRTVPVRLDRPFAVAVLDGSGTVPLLAGYQAERPGSPPARTR